jgi:hypothetical protein
MSVTFLSLFFSAIWINLVVGMTNEAGVQFLQENKLKPGVVMLPSGLQYKILQSGEGTKHPKPDSECKVDYEAVTLDGSQIDSSYIMGEPYVFAPNEVLPGMQEALQLMVEGDTWELYVSAELGVRDADRDDTVEGEVIIYTVKLVEIEGDVIPAMCKVDGFVRCSDKEIKYIERIREWDASKHASEYQRLKGIQGSKVKKELKLWLDQRVNILVQTPKPFKPVGNEKDEL